MLLTKIRFWFGWLCGILAAGLFLTDCFGHTEHVQGQVVDRSYREAYDNLVCSTDPQTQVMECHNEHHEAEYWLKVRSSEGLASVGTTADNYYTIHEGQTLTYSRVRTRWSNYTWGSSY